MAKTTMATLAAAKWEDIERDVVTRIRTLAMTARAMGKPPQSDLADQIANDLILPNIMLLERFCEAVDLDDADLVNARQESTPVGRQGPAKVIYDISRWPVKLREAWARMGGQCCAGCGWPMVPAFSGGDEPGYRGFEPCKCGRGDQMPRPRRPELLDVHFD